MVNLEIEILSADAKEYLYELRNYLNEHIENLQVSIKEQPALEGQMSPFSAEGILNGVIHAGIGIGIEQCVHVLLPVLKDFFKHMPVPFGKKVEILATLGLPDSLSVIHLFENSPGFLKSWYEHQMNNYYGLVKILREQDYLTILNAIKPNINTGTRGGEFGDEIEAPKDKTAEGKKKLALVVATNNYEANGMWQHLQNPVNDGKAIAEILRKDYGYDVKILLDAPQDSILAAISDLGDKATNPYTQVVIYFAGHGFYDKRQESGYVVCKDSKAIRDYSKPTMSELRTYLDYTVIFKNLDKSFNKIIFITDVCFGGTSLNSLMPMKQEAVPKNVPDVLKNPYKSVLASGVIEVDDYMRLQNGGISTNSPFAISLINILKNKKGNPLSFEELSLGVKNTHLDPEPIDFSFGQVAKPNVFIF